MLTTKTYLEYRAELSDLVDATGDPALATPELDRCLGNARVADPLGNPPDVYMNWTPDTVIPPGSYIVPTARDGYVYYSALGGTTGPSEPSEWSASTIDNTVTWTRYAYAPWGGYYDLNRAAAEGWRIKAARASKRKNVSAFGQTNQRTTTYEHCMEMARVYTDKIADSIPLSGVARRKVY